MEKYYYKISSGILLGLTIGLLIGRKGEQSCPNGSHSISLGEIGIVLFGVIMVWLMGFLTGKEDN